MINFIISMLYDVLFKFFFMYFDIVWDFMEIYLFKDLCELCDFDSLKLEFVSFVDEKLWVLYFDILWLVKICEGDGYIYVVIEY